MPKHGTPLDLDDIRMILEAVSKRKEKFPEEDGFMTFALVMLNIGERFRSVACIEGEWIGKKMDVEKPPEGRVPSCPNGHPLVEANQKITLGWVAVSD